MSDQPALKNPFGSDKEIETFQAQTRAEASSSASASDVTNERQPSGPRLKDLKSSRAFSVSSPAWERDRSKGSKITNPNAIPTAGGQTLGARAFEERRASRVSEDIGGGARASALPDREPEPTTHQQQSTITNVTSSNESGEGSSKMTEETGKTDESSASAAPVSPGAPPAAPAAATEVSTANAAEQDGGRVDSKGVESKTDVVKDKLGLDKQVEGEKRRPSVFSKLFGKK